MPIIFPAPGLSPEEHQRKTEAFFSVFFYIWEWIFDFYWRKGGDPIRLRFSPHCTISQRCLIKMFSLFTAESDFTKRLLIFQACYQCEFMFAPLNFLRFHRYTISLTPSIKAFHAEDGRWQDSSCFEGYGIDMLPLIQHVRFTIFTNITSGFLARREHIPTQWILLTIHIKVIFLHSYIRQSLTVYTWDDDLSLFPSSRIKAISKFWKFSLECSHECLQLKLYLCI